MPLKTIEKKLYEKINGYRISQTLNTMDYDEDVAAIARGHSENMAAGRCDFGHDAFDERAARLSTQFEHISENVAYYEGHPLNEDIVLQFWLKSTRHVEIITGDYDVTGVGIAKNDHTYFITQLFLKKQI